MTECMNDKTEKGLVKSTNHRTIEHRQTNHQPHSHQPTDPIITEPTETILF